MNITIERGREPLGGGMMSKYREVATRAVGLMLWAPGTGPADAWVAAAIEVFPESAAARVKACPRGAFLGLCEAGVVSGVPPGAYTRSILNKEYAVRALDALRSSPELAKDHHRLWQAATTGKDVQPNSQMEVLTALWDAGLVR